MRVAFDIHGTLDSDQKLRDFVKILNVNPKFEVFIISGPPTTQIEAELDILGIKGINRYKIISVVDYLKGKGVTMKKAFGNWWCDEDVWWDSKGAICAEYSIDLIFDDKIKYKRNMPSHTKFVLWIG